MDVVTAMDSNGLEAAEKLKKLYPDIKIIIITSMPEYSYITRAREIGVESFWYKEPTAESLIDIMEKTMAGESVYPDDTPVMKLGAALSNDFTERELQVLKEVVSGKSDSAIAETLYISVATVKQHIQRIREKTKFTNRTELAVRARESGIVISDHRTEGNLQLPGQRYLPQREFPCNRRSYNGLDMLSGCSWRPGSSLRICRRGQPPYPLSDEVPRTSRTHRFRSPAPVFSRHLPRQSAP